MNRLRLIWQAIRLDKRGIDEALEAFADIQEFYVARDNYNPEPLPKAKTMPIRFDDDNSIPHSYAGSAYK